MSRALPWLVNYVLSRLIYSKFPFFASHWTHLLVMKNISNQGVMKSLIRDITPSFQRDSVILFCNGILRRLFYCSILDSWWVCWVEADVLSFCRICVVLCRLRQKVTTAVFEKRLRSYLDSNAIKGVLYDIMVKRTSCRKRVNRHRRRRINTFSVAVLCMLLILCLTVIIALHCAHHRLHSWSNSQPCGKSMKSIKWLSDVLKP